MTVSVILTTAPDTRCARRIARALVQRRLAACVSVRGGFISVYRWKGKVESARESLLLIKTSDKNFKAVEQAIQEMHSYEIPEILGLSARKCSTRYRRWLTGSVR